MSEELASDADRYARFRDGIAAADPVEVTEGPGGLSFYVVRDGRRRFACHFNARPRRSEVERGFADFKPHGTGLDPERTMTTLESLLSGRAACRRTPTWWSAHFAASEDALVAMAFRHAVMIPLLHGQEVSSG